MTAPSPTSGPGRDRPVIDGFHALYYGARLWERTTWLGVPAYKCPLDLWIYQEIIHQTRPDVIVETGTAHGGSALFMATVCQAAGRGRVVTIDTTPRARMPQHPRITYLRGSSIDPGTLDRVRSLIEQDERVMVVLDSLHNRDHVLAELRAYAPLVTVGCLLIAEDTNINGHPVHTDYAPDQGPGPFEVFPDMERRIALPAPGVIVCTRERDDPGHGISPQEFLYPLVRSVRIETVKDLRLERKSIFRPCLPGVKKRDLMSPSAQAFH